MYFEAWKIRSIQYIDLYIVLIENIDQQWYVILTSIDTIIWSYYVMLIFSDG